MTRYIAHLAVGYETLCGEPWQGWQAPIDDLVRYAPTAAILPPHSQPTPEEDEIRPCGGCHKRVVDGAQ
jgi:hypothetical protein